MEFRVKKVMVKGENYGKYFDEDIVKIDINNFFNFWILMLFIIVVLVMSFILLKYIFLNVKLDYLLKYEIFVFKVIGNWSLIIFLVIFIIVVFIFNYKKMENFLNILIKGVNGLFLVVMNIVLEVGYGNVIVGFVVFVIVKSVLFGFFFNLLILEVVLVFFFVGIMGFVFGGLSIVLGVLGEVYLKEV